jgi:hypothetical protein
MGRNLNFPPQGAIMSIKEKELKLPLGTNVFEFFYIITFAYEF